MKILRTEKIPKYVKIKARGLQFIDDREEDIIININGIMSYKLKSNIVSLSNGRDYLLTDKDSIHTITNFLYNNLI